MKRIVMIIMVVALVALPTMAQQQEWQSTSSMTGSGSNYSSQVTEVGASGVASMGTTTESYSPAKGPNRAKKDFLDPTNPGNQSNEYPIGDAVLPLLLLACAYFIIRATRKRTMKS